jgi:TM2 domain-containing membrane protein YozV
MENKSKKNWLTTLMLCWFLGFLGVHRLYAGKLGSGFLMAYGTICACLIMFVNIYLGLAAFTIVGAAVVNDFSLICLKRFQDCYGKDIALDRLG